MKITGAEVGDSVFFACGKKNDVEKITALARDKIAKELDLIDGNIFAFCWIVDYPMFEKNESLTKLSLVIIHFQCLQRVDIQKILDF